MQFVAGGSEDLGLVAVDHETHLALWKEYEIQNEPFFC